MKSTSIILAGLAAVFTLTGAELQPLRVEGKKVMAGDCEIRLRGINWGWWHHKGTVYTENDMREQAAWGANTLRFAISYFDVIKPDGTWDEEAFAHVDEVVKWAAKHNQYVILDLHLAPGGQNFMPNPDGHKNQIWTDKKFQEQYFYLWRKLAERYKDNPAVAAYEVMNEPVTAGKPERLFDLNRRVVAEIRKVDPDKIIVLGGDEMSHVKTLVDGLKVADDNVIYTFHFYEGAWLGNKIGEKHDGTSDWTQIEMPIEVPENASGLTIMLRSDDNSGAAWFDDVALTDASGKVLHSFNFDKGAAPLSVERAPYEKGSYDAAAGHDKPGSVRIGGTTSYNSWRTPEYDLKPGTYTLSAWVKLDKATGGTYLCAALFGSAKYTPEDFDRLLKPATDFSRKHNVPLLVGEFSITGRNAPRGLQAQAIADRIAAFEKDGMNWTYWNFRETTGPNSMALHPQGHPVNKPLLEALKTGWKKNGQPVR